MQTGSFGQKTDYGGITLLSRDSYLQPGHALSWSLNLACFSYGGVLVRLAPSRGGESSFHDLFLGDVMRRKRMHQRTHVIGPEREACSMQLIADGRRCCLRPVTCAEGGQVRMGKRCRRIIGSKSSSIIARRTSLLLVLCTLSKKNTTTAYWYAIGNGRHEYQPSLEVDVEVRRRYRNH